MAHHAFLLQFGQGGQRLVAHLLQATGQICLELYVVHIDQVDEVHAEALHALVDTLRGPAGRVVPRVHTIVAIAPHLSGEVVFITWHAAQGFAQHRLGLQMPIVRRHVDEVDAAVQRRMHGTDAVGLVDAVEHAAQRRSSEREVGHPHSSLSNFVVNHIF